MTYSKNYPGGWKNKPDLTTPITAATLDNIETQYEDAATDLAAKKLDDLATPDDNTDLDSTTTEHGLLPKLDNDATHFLNGQGAWTVKDLVIGDTEVYDSTAPGAFTDLDLSAVVGSNSAVVLLKVTTSTSTDDRVHFRKNGEAAVCAAHGASGGGTMLGNEIIYVVVVTDASGIVEWKATGTTLTNWKVNVEAYWV